MPDPLALAQTYLAAARQDNEVGRFDDAAGKLDLALGAIDGSSSPDAGRLRIRVLITRSWTELELRGLDPALAMLHDARAQAVAADDRRLVALSRVQEGVIQVRGGDWAASLAALDGVGEDEESLDASQRCALLINRGMAHLGLGHSALARADLKRAAAIAQAGGLRDQEFKARHNLACLAFVDGDLARALVLMRRAEGMQTAVSQDRARLDSAEVLLEAGLVDQGRAVLCDALASARAQGHRLEEGEISARLARCDLLLDDLEGARRHIRSAMAAYRTRQLDGLLHEAALIRSTIDVAAGSDLPAVVADLERRNENGHTGSATDRAALRLEAEARLLVGDADGAQRCLSRLEHRSHDSLAARLHEALVRARLDEACGRPAEAQRRIRTGNRLLAAHQFQSSSLTVRAALALHGRRLAAFDVGRALDGGDPEDILTSIERWRAISHRINPVAISTDPELAGTTRKLRRLRRVAAARGAHASAELVATIARLEEDVSRREWSLTVGGTSAGALPPVGADEARAASGHRGTTVVEFFEAEDALWTIVVDEGRLEVTRTAALTTVREEVTRLRRDLRARALVAPGSPMEGALERATAFSLAAVDATVHPGGRGRQRVVVIPSSSLAAVPWSLLPSLTGRPVTVSPSLTRWVRGPSQGPGAGWRVPVAALYGPGLSRTEPEIRAIRASWSREPVPETLRPATSEEVLRALGSARVVHLAAHGVHEAQSPLFSSVEMADGPVFAHEFPRPVAAEHVSLSACDVGQFSTRAGDEPLGLAIALLALGATSVLAAVAPVADRVAADAMVAYHALLATGADAATAWAQVVRDHRAAGVFCLYGSDWSSADAASGGLR